MLGILVHRQAGQARPAQTVGIIRADELNAVPVGVLHEQFGFVEADAGHNAREVFQHLPRDQLRLLIAGHHVPVDAMPHQRRKVRVGTGREQRPQAAPLPVVVERSALVVIEDAGGFAGASVEDEHGPAAEAVV